MTVKTTVRLQYARVVDATATQAAVALPKEGWITTMRKALGMSASNLAARLGVNRSAVYQAAQNERTKAISIGQMEKIAEAMGGRFVYAIVPDGSIEDIILREARRKARSSLLAANSHMALERQGASAGELDKEIDRLAWELAIKLPTDFWG